MMFLMLMPVLGLTSGEPAAGHTNPNVAVCLVGELRSIGLTAPSLRQNLLEVADADAFVVALTFSQSEEERAKRWRY